MGKHRTSAIGGGVVLAAASAVLLFGGASASSAGADSSIRLPRIFGSHMVLQRDAPIPVWGWAGPGETVTASIAEISVRATANAAGEWKTALPPLPAGGPYVMSVAGSSTSSAVALDDVLIGEVWLCSGQSNMEMGVRLCRDADAEIAAANYPRIRLFRTPKRFAATPQRDIRPTRGAGEWKQCTSETIAEDGWGGFSASAYFFGRDIHRALDVPVGLIEAAWGGSVIQTWTPPEGFALVPALKDEYERVLAADDVAKSATSSLGSEPPRPRDHQDAAAVYDAMIHPIRPFALRGAIWYQGESNIDDGALYTDRMKALIGGWRQVWGQGDFPFYYVQIAPCRRGRDPTIEPLFWEAQAAAQSVANTGMVVTNDIGDLASRHPTDKQDVGKRFALWALAKTYGENVACRGPTFRSFVVEGDSLRVTFDDVGAGLETRDGMPPAWFETIDADVGGFVAADARIEGDSVVLSAPGVARPVAVRFAWSMLAQPNLENSDGLPAGAFRAGVVPDRELGK